MSDRQVRIGIAVQVSYSDDVPAALAILQDAALTQERVLKSPAPAAFLHSFGDSGINLELGIWIADPEGGALGLRSAIQLEILERFRAAGIEIPFPQRELRIMSAPNASALPGDAANT
ncbi:MAG: hypothetical protein B7Z51_06430 [Methyloversatilis sp. 12-65-5]|nr:MAG: hypothetical protein B7Z51_06430 [Methyloversatilis sp. 12-65-5]